MLVNQIAVLLSNENLYIQVDTKSSMGMHEKIQTDINFTPGKISIHTQQKMMTKADIGWS